MLLVMFQIKLQKPPRLVLKDKACQTKTTKILNHWLPFSQPATILLTQQYQKDVTKLARSCQVRSGQRCQIRSD